MVFGGRLADDGRANVGERAREREREGEREKKFASSIKGSVCTAHIAECTLCMAPTLHGEPRQNK